MIKKVNISEDLELQIISYYSSPDPHTIAATAKFFGITGGSATRRIRNILKKYNISEHPAELNTKLKVDAWKDNRKNKSKEEIELIQEKTKQTNLNRYGAENVFAAQEIKEKIKQTNLEKYGVEFSAQATEVKEKIVNTNLKKFGCAQSFAAKAIREKSYKTKLEKYGDGNYVNSEKAKNTKLERYNDPTYNNVEKNKQTCIEKYGVDNAAKSDIIKEKIKQTNLEKYGVECVLSSSEIQEKIKQTNLEKYGYEYATQSHEVKTKIEQTFINRYGEKTYFKTKEFHKIARKLYFFENEYFDSFPELALYIYAKDNKLKVIRTPKCFEFMYNGIIHYYFPDFELDGELIEIKGDHFFKEDGTMCNPYDHSQDELYEAKHQCGLTNNVKFYTSNDYAKFIDYFNTAGYIKEDFLVKKEID